MKQRLLIILSSLMLLSVWGMFSAFQSEEKAAVPKPTKQDLIQAAVEERINTFIRIRQQTCLEDRLKDANLRVDSILIVRAKSQRDTVNKPPKPFKPERPEILSLEDTTPIAPILVPETDTSINQNND